MERRPPQGRSHREAREPGRLRPPLRPRPGRRSPLRPRRLDQPSPRRGRHRAHPRLPPRRPLHREPARPRPDGARLPHGGRVQRQRGRRGLETAWSLQTERAADRRIPPPVTSPRSRSTAPSARSASSWTACSPSPRARTCWCSSTRTCWTPPRRSGPACSPSWTCRGGPPTSRSRPARPISALPAPRPALPAPAPGARLGPAVRGGKRLLAATGTADLAKRALVRRARRPPMRPEFEARRAG